MISQGEKLPQGTLLKMGQDGPVSVALAEALDGRKVVLFAVPGAYTGTCHAVHVPSFIKAMDDLKAKGAEEVICVSVNDPFVMKAWGEETGATEAGITMLADADGGWTKALGLDFDAPPAGLYGRSQRYAMVIEDGTVAHLAVEENPGVCEVSAGKAVVQAM